MRLQSSPRAGIGLAIAKKFLAAGFHVVANARGKERLVGAYADVSADEASRITCVHRRRQGARCYEVHNVRTITSTLHHQFTRPLPGARSFVAADAATREGIAELVATAGNVDGAQGALAVLVNNGGGAAGNPIGDVFGAPTWSDDAVEGTIRIFCECLWARLQDRSTPRIRIANAVCSVADCMPPHV